MNSAPSSVRTAPDVAITLRDFGETLRGWSGFTVTSAIDAAADAFAFMMPFNSTPRNRDRFIPFSPGVVEIKANGRQFSLGYIEHIVGDSSKDSRTAFFEGRSASGAIVEWSAGPVWDRTNKIFKAEPAFEYAGMTAGEIARQVAAAHLVYFQPDTAPLDEISFEPGDTLFKVLGQIAESNGYFGVPQTDGSLIYRNDLGQTPPVADLIEGQSPLERITTDHNVTSRFWKYLVTGSATGEGVVSAESIDRALAPAIRGVKIVKTDQQSANIQAAANQARARALIDSYSAKAYVKGFSYNDAAGDWHFWRGGDVVNVYAPGAFIYRKSKLIVKHATFSYDENNGQSTILDLALPELYSGGFPEAFAWAA